MSHGGGWRRSRTPEGIRVVNDAYNANPESVAAALKTGRWMAGDGAIDRGPRHRWPSSARSPPTSTNAWASSPRGSAVDRLIDGGDRTRRRSRSRPIREGVEPDAAVAYDDPDAALADVCAHAAPGDVVAREGLPGRRPGAGRGTARGGAAVISILVAAAVRPGGHAARDARRDPRVQQLGVGPAHPRGRARTPTWRRWARRRWAAS